MKTISILLLALGATGLCSADTVLYAPSRSIADQQITVHPWGSGTIAETDETAFEGNTSIRVSARNLFSGGKIEFNATPDMTKDYDDKSDLLRITFKAAESGAAMGGGGAGRSPGGPSGGPGGGGGGGRPPSGGSGGRGGLGGGPAGAGTGGGVGQAGPGGAGGNQLGGSGHVAGGASAAKSELKQLRMVITTTDGLKSEAYVPANLAPGTRGWLQVGIPLQAITGFGRTNKVIKEIGFSTDTNTTIYIGDMRTIVDTTPITGDTNTHDLNLAEGDEVVLSATGTGGASMLKYEWYFDKDTSGMPDAVGQAIKHKFRKPDTYTITCVISDYFGLKQPYKTTIIAKVN